MLFCIFCNSVYLAGLATQRPSSEAIRDSFDERHAKSTQRYDVSHSATTARVVEAADVRPEVLDGAREGLAEAGQDDEAQRDADRGVDHRQYATAARHWDDLAVTCPNMHQTNWKN